MARKDSLPMLTDSPGRMALVLGAAAVACCTAVLYARRWLLVTETVAAHV